MNDLRERIGSQGLQPRGTSGKRRLVVLSPWDGADRSVVSGTAYGLARALEGLGVTLEHAPGPAPRRLIGLASRGTKLRWRLTARDASDAWRLGKESILTRSAWASFALHRIGDMDGIIQLTSDCSVRRPVAPLATYDDMTIVQAVDLGYPQWRLARRDVAWRISRQRTTYERAVACCTRSAWAAESIRADYGIDPDKIKVVGVGSNREFNGPVTRSWEAPTFLIVAADWERKNGRAVTEAFAEVRKRHPTARLHVVGRHPALEAPGVEPHGFLRLGNDAEKARLDRLFAEATCFVMPSLHEPLGISYAEAGAAGIPSIGTTSGGAREVIGPGGTVVDPHDGRALVDAMMRFCEPAEASAAGELAREHAQLYTWPRVAKRILNVLGLLSPSDDPEAELLPGVS